MKKVFLLTVMLCLAASAAYGGPLRQLKKQQREPNRQSLQPGLRPNAVRPAVRRSLAQDAVYGFYVRQFQRDPELGADAAKVLPFLDEFLQDRFEISARRTRALNQLNQAMSQESNEEELKRLTKEIDAADTESQANHEKFLNSVDPLLNPRQQARIRVLLNRSDNQIRQTLEAMQNANGQRRNAAPRAPED
jgi:hypothetical protein